MKIHTRLFNAIAPLLFGKFLTSRSLDALTAFMQSVHLACSYTLLRTSTPDIARDRILSSLPLELHYYITTLCISRTKDELPGSMIAPSTASRELGPKFTPLISKMQFFKIF